MPLGNRQILNVGPLRDIFRQTRNFLRFGSNESPMTQNQKSKKLALQRESFFFEVGLKVRVLDLGFLA